MKLTFAEFWRPSGTISRGTYALVGVLGFALKHNLDRLLATYGFHHPWGLFNYWVPLRDVGRITNLRSSEAEFLAAMLALSLPFIWIGVTLTMKRLRSAQLPVGLAILFFVPFLNLLFFLVLCLMPEREAALSAQGPSRPSRFVRILPDNVLGSAVMAVLFTVPIGLALVLLGERVLDNYGWGLFVALPFAMGFAAAVIYGLRRPRSLKASVGVACLSATLLGTLLFAVAVEGMMCLIMAAPLALPLAAFGGLCGYRVQRQRWMRTAPALLSALLIFVPGVQWMEHIAAPRSPIFVVRSAIDIQAPPEKVWKQVVAFTRIPPPEEWIFRVGIAYPIQAQIFGTGPGAERHCVFSTGAFVEPIEIWDEPHRLKFSVTSNPPPLEEWSPYAHIEPPHLRGYLVAEGGQFLLTPLPNGGTRLEGTTWYQHGLWPAEYWRLWSDPIIHRIHMRVLRHIRTEAEK